MTIVNFGRNVQFTPRLNYHPRTEDEVLAILNRHSRGTIRVVGALHSWSPAVVSDDVAIDLRHFRSVSVETTSTGLMSVVVGAGCRIKHLLQELHRKSEWTLPSLGLIIEQAVGGAISTATHGSGKSSLSHYVMEVRVASYDPMTGEARIYTWGENDPELRAARCALGCMGILLAVRFRCVPRYDVQEVMHSCDTLGEVLAGENQFPLQQFYLVPHRDTFFVQRRFARPELQARGWRAKLFRAWWFLGIDVALHLIIFSLVRGIKSPRITRWFFRCVLPKLVLKNVTVVDRAERMLVMEHELFRHLEIELFVSAKHLAGAVALTQATLTTFAGCETDLSSIPTDELRSELLQHKGTFTHHYPVTFRRVLPDDTFLSMTADAQEPWYAISFITYAEPRDPFLVMARFLARVMGREFAARPHWGKFFPLDAQEVAAIYPRLPEFRTLCNRVDPHGVFRNAFTRQVIFES